MPKSMTAFARGEQKDGELTLRCEMRSVNHRFLDLSLQLPDSLRDLEFDLRDLIRGRIQRGKIYCSLVLEVQRDTAQGVELDEQLALGYVRSAEKLAAHLPQPAPISPLDLLRMPGVLRTEQVAPESLAQSARKLVALVLDDFVETRAREGEALRQAMLERLDTIDARVNDVAGALPGIRAHLEQRLRKRLEELQVDINNERLEQELVIQAQRMDVDEEIDRLRTHLVEMRRQLDQDEPVGRRLDFLSQELNREANTLASKSQAVVSTQVAVDIKVCIEQIREQIQNIE